MKKSEHSEQCALIDWARRTENKHPELKMLYANANGGKRHIGTAVKLKKEGVKAGIPDLTLASWGTEEVVDSKGFHYREDYPILYIEMKFGKNKLTKEQKECIADLRAQGYRCEVCYSFEEARDAICDYLGIKE